jgi:hypothetical protein
MKLFIVQFSLHPPVTSSFLGANILLSSLSSDTFNLCPSVTVKHQVSIHTKQQVE